MACGARWTGGSIKNNRVDLFVGDGKKPLFDSDQTRHRAFGASESARGLAGAGLPHRVNRPGTDGTAPKRLSRRKRALTRFLNSAYYKIGN